MTGLVGYVLLPIAALLAVPWLLHWWFTRPDDLDEPWRPVAWTDQDQALFEQHADWNGNR